MPMRCIISFTCGSPRLLAHFRHRPSLTVLSPSIRVMNTETAETLRALLVSVVEEGTGYRAANRYCGAGGKTASAQTGRYQEGEEIVHAWFGGFFPAGEPKYVLVVFQEGGRAGGQTPASVFRAISEAVYCTENPGPADYGG